MGAEKDRSGAPGFALPRQVRITASGEIRTLFRRGKRRKTRHLDVFVSASPAAYPRLGLVVPKPRQKKLGAGAALRGVGGGSPQAGRGVRRGGAAVQRNRLKRRLRELGRTVLLPALREAQRPLDVLVRTRPEAYGASFAELSEQLRQLTEELCSRRS